jgi:hypothetical protein
MKKEVYFSLFDNSICSLIKEFEIITKKNIVNVINSNKKDLRAEEMKSV